MARDNKPAAVGGWLIEDPIASGPLFYGRANGSGRWTERHSEALRFKSREDAREYAVSYSRYFPNGVRFTEHRTR